MIGRSGEQVPVSKIFQLESERRRYVRVLKVPDYGVVIGQNPDRDPDPDVRTSLVPLEEPNITEGSL